jgi:uncharacterized protein YdiU (UPF0061 family)
MFDDTNELVEVLDSYDGYFWKRYCGMMGNKMGLDEIRPGDNELINQLEKALILIKPDMTIFFRLLADLPPETDHEVAATAHFKDSFYKPLAPEESQLLYGWIKAYLERLQTNTCTREWSVEMMKSGNPRFILRNYLLHQAIEELEKGDNSFFMKLQQAIREPYAEKADEFFRKRPDWASEKAGCSMLSCSS